MQFEISSTINGRVMSVKFIGDTTPELMNEFASQIPAYLGNQAPLQVFVDRAEQGKALRDVTQVRGSLPFFNRPKFG